MWIHVRPLALFFLLLFAWDVNAAAFYQSPCEASEKQFEERSQSLVLCLRDAV